MALLAGLVVVGVVVGHTHGRRPAAGALYTGTVDVETAAGEIVQRLPISFAIETSGRGVDRFRFPAGLPRACPRRTVGHVAVRPASAALRNTAHFEINLALSDRDGRVGTLELSGTFHSLNREAGAVAAAYSAPGLRGCDAGGGYTAKATS